MADNDTQEQLGNIARPSHDPGVILPPQAGYVNSDSPEEKPCSTCGGDASMTITYVYAIGRVEARFPSLSIEKEFAQIGGRSDTAGKTDQQVFYEIFSRPENRYLARQMCWVFTIHELDTYILVPRNPIDIDLLVSAIRSETSDGDLDLVVGVLGPIAPPVMCNGLAVPVVAFDQIYSFTRQELIRAIPKPEKATKVKFEPAAEEMFDRIIQLTDNAGATDEHRALNYLAARYSKIFSKAVEQFDKDFSLSRIEVKPSNLSSARRILEVIFSYTDRKTDFTEKFFVRVDVNEEFPFMVTKLLPYFDL